MKKIILWFVSTLVVILLILLVIAYLQDRPPTPVPTPTKDKLIGKLIYSTSDENMLVISGAAYIFNKEKQLTNTQGEFEYYDGENISFTIANQTFTLTAKAEISLTDLVDGEVIQQRNLASLLVNIDDDDTVKNGIQLGSLSKKITDINLSQSEDAFYAQLYLQLGHNPKLTFTPTLGINLESAQAKADTVGQAMPFVDVFRTARPFTELSPKGIRYDKHGWPTHIPEGSFARTKLLQGTLKDAMPNGDYTVLYEGKGKLSFGSDALLNITKKDDNETVLTLKTKDSSNYTETNSLSLVINETDPNDPIRNIRIIMPDGICRDKNRSLDEPVAPNQSKDNPFLRVTDGKQCPEGSVYTSFVDLLRQQRNLIVFNPDYLQHLRNFRVIRLMNLMEASPSYQCQNLKKKQYQRCLDKAIAWDQRAVLDDAVWGGSSRSDFAQHKGVPIEVLVSLANQLNRDPWFTFPHYADDEYIEQFAHYVHQHLKTELKPHLEYSNETWNPGFQSHYYAKQKGMDTGLDDVPAAFENQANRGAGYFAQLHYYTKRSLDIFDIWNTVFEDDKQRLIKIISGQQGDIVRSEEMLKYLNASEKVDALAIAPYFYGCIDRSRKTKCTFSDHVLDSVESVDDIFGIIDHNSSRIGGDPSALQGALDKIEKQAEIAQKYGVKLFTYEGGQHLTIMGSMGNLEQGRKNELRALFREANRDPRMKERYLKLLTDWKVLHETNNSIGLFTLYTMAQSYYDYGSWGLKESLTQDRDKAPKFDAVMEFQEQSVGDWLSKPEDETELITAD